jgi:hypothetical protein
VSGLVTLFLALGVLAAILLIGTGAGLLLRGSSDRTRAWLMLLAGVVVLVNIWLYATLPGGTHP